MQRATTPASRSPMSRSITPCRTSRSETTSRCQQLPDALAQPGHRLPGLPRCDATRAHAQPAAPARRGPAHQRHAARDRSVSGAPGEAPVRQERIQRLPHSDRRAAGRHARAARRRPANAPGCLRARQGGRGFRQARDRLLQQPDGARWRLARLAQGHGAADLPGRCRAQAEARRSQRADARAHAAFISCSSTTCATPSRRSWSSRCTCGTSCMRTNELQDDATVKQKLESLRARDPQRRGFRGACADHSQDPGSALRRRRSGLGQSRYVRAGLRQAARRELKDNEISEPFRTQYGWHIVQLLGRRKFDDTDELQRKHALEDIRASRADEETEIWLRRLRDEAYVDCKL